MNYNGLVTAGKPIRFPVLSMLHGKISCFFVNKTEKTPNQAMNAEDFLSKASRTGSEPPDHFSL